VNVFFLAALRMSIADNLRTIRRDRNLTLQQMADLVGLHLNQVRRYEIGETQPSLDALKKIAVALSISADDLIFGQDERGPDEALKLKFEAVRQFDPDERKIAEGVLDSLINNHQAKRLFAKQSTEHSNS
jgi:transcriptional regulator with XRE-family HTH domain